MLITGSCLSYCTDRRHQCDVACDPKARIQLLVGVKLDVRVRTGRFYASKLENIFPAIPLPGTQVTTCVFSCSTPYHTNN